LSVNPKIFSLLSARYAPQVMKAALSIQRQKQRHVDVHVDPIGCLGIPNNATVVSFCFCRHILFYIGKVMVAICAGCGVIEAIN
jgi:hypothetical protein